MWRRHLCGPQRLKPGSEVTGPLHALATSSRRPTGRTSAAGGVGSPTHTCVLQTERTATRRATACADPPEGQESQTNVAEGRGRSCGRAGPSPSPYSSAAPTPGLFPPGPESGCVKGGGPSLACAMRTSTRVGRSPQACWGQDCSQAPSLPTRASLRRHRANASTVFAGPGPPLPTGFLRNPGRRHHPGHRHRRAPRGRRSTSSRR